MFRYQLLISFLILTPCLSAASYLNSCDLDIKVTKLIPAKSDCTEKKGDDNAQESCTIQIDGKVINAAPSGRADGGCQRYIGNKSVFPLSVTVDRVNFRPGDVITVNRYMRDGHLHPMSISTTFLGVKEKDDYRYR